MVVIGGGAFSYERGTPAGLGVVIPVGVLAVGAKGWGFIFFWFRGIESGAWRVARIIHRGA